MTQIRVLLVLSVGLVGGNALAQYGAAPSTTIPTVAAPSTSAATPAASTWAVSGTCTKPGHYPGKKASDNKKEAWIKEVGAWGECVRAQVAGLRALVEAKIKLANSTVEEYNLGVKELQEEQKVAALVAGYVWAGLTMPEE